MDAMRYAAFMCLCAVERTPQKEYDERVADLCSDDLLDATDFEYKVGGKHYASREEIMEWLRYLRVTAASFFGVEKSNALGL